MYIQRSSHKVHIRYTWFKCRSLLLFSSGELTLLMFCFDRAPMSSCIMYRYPVAPNLANLVRKAAVHHSWDYSGLLMYKLWPPRIQITGESYSLEYAFLNILSW